MNMLRKMIDCESLETSQETFYEGVSFKKVTSLQCSNCNFTDSFWNMYRKLAGLKIIF